MDAVMCCWCISLEMGKFRHDLTKSGEGWSVAQNSGVHHVWNWPSRQLLECWMGKFKVLTPTWQIGWVIGIFANMRIFERICKFGKCMRCSVSRHPHIWCLARREKRCRPRLIFKCFNSRVWRILPLIVVTAFIFFPFDGKMSVISI